MAIKKQVRAVCEDGVCPLCGGDLEYGEREICDDGSVIKWECPGCGATGWAGFEEVFDGHHYDVRDRAGNEIEILPPADSQP